MNDIDLSQETPEYQAFVNKFRPKKTTDDCYTPPEIYDVILDWVCDRYGIDRSKVVRPFFPGGDYEHYDYGDGAVVVNNPPFSILSKILQFYLDRNIPFFLFCPSLTAFGGKRTFFRCTHIVADATVIYENGAVVKTAFVTNLDDPNLLVTTAPDLGRIVNAKTAELRATVKPPKYDYPVHALTAARCQYFAAHGVTLNIRRGDCVMVSALDSQRAAGKGMYGNGLLLSERAARERAEAERAARERAEAERAARERAEAERAARERAEAERAADYVWSLSPRELDIIASMGGAVNG